MTALAFPSRSKLLLLLLASGLLPGCAGWLQRNEPQLPPPVEEQTIEEHGFYLNGEDSVIGRLASVPVQAGDTLLDIARHFGLGYQHVVEANPDLDPWVPKDGARVLLPLQFILPDTQHKGVVINLAAMRLFYFTGGKYPALNTWPIGIGKEGRSTPLGGMTVVRKTEHPTWYVPESIRRDHERQGDPLPAVVPPGPDNPLGDYALYLSKPSYLIHGTDKPYSIGLRASNGCIRLYPEDIERAFLEIPPKTPVQVVNQPYVLGWLGGELYLEAHQPFEEVDAKTLKRNLFAKLRQIGGKHKRKLDWPKIEDTIKQGRGIPVPIFEGTESLHAIIADAVPLERPAQLVGETENPEPVKEGWFVRTAETDDEYRARRLAAMLNHLGPKIPARTTANDRTYQVIAGPFASGKAAQKAKLILLTDFETKSEIIKPGNMSVRKPAPKLVVRQTRNERSLD